MRLKQAVLGGLLFVLATPAVAKPEFLEVFKNHYAPPEGSDLFNARCGTCHTGPSGGARNAYGSELERFVEVSDTGDLTMQILQEVEVNDSDGDGASNLDEISAATLPGDPSSAPGSGVTGASTTGSSQGDRGTTTASDPSRPASSRPPAGATPSSPRASSPGASSPPLVPTHTFHPAIVHFPIALFLFGAALDFWGWRRKHGDARRFAMVALSFGAITGLVAVLSGLVAMLRMELTLEGDMLIHLLSGVASSLAMVLVALWQKRSVPTSGAYWIALALTVFLVGVAGHYGSKMVWG